MSSDCWLDQQSEEHPLLVAEEYALRMHPLISVKSAVSVQLILEKHCSVQQSRTTRLNTPQCWENQTMDITQGHEPLPMPLTWTPVEVDPPTLPILPGAGNPISQPLEAARGHHIFKQDQWWVDKYGQTDNKRINHVILVQLCLKVRRYWVDVWSLLFTLRKSGHSGSLAVLWALPICWNN